MWSAVAAGGGAAGALFGGFLTQYLSWRWILFVNVPIGIVLFFFARLYLVESRAEGPRRRLDVAGSITVTAGLLALVYTIVHTDQVAWTSASTLITGAIAVVLLAAFVLIEARLADHPLVPLRLFRSRALTGANLVMFCFGVAMFAMWFFLSLYLQQVLGYDPVVTGLTFLPQTAAIAVGATIAGRLAPEVGPRNVLIAGALLAAGGLYWLSFIQAGDTYWTGACGGGIMATFGMGLAFTPIALSATGGVRREEAGLASGLVNSSRQIGASLGLAVLSTVAASHIASLLAGRAGHPRGAAGGHDRRLRPGLPHRLGGGPGRRPAGPDHPEARVRRHPGRRPRWPGRGRPGRARRPAGRALSGRSPGRPPVVAGVTVGRPGRPRCRPGPGVAGVDRGQRCRVSTTLNSAA